MALWPIGEWLTFMAYGIMVYIGMTYIGITLPIMANTATSLLFLPILVWLDSYGHCSDGQYDYDQFELWPR